MNVSDVFKFVHENLSPILGTLTIISFIVNIVQYNTKKSVGCILDSIYHTCFRTIRRNEKIEKSNEELINTIFIIRTESVSGLRAIGIGRSYGLYDHSPQSGILYRFFRNQYILLMKIKEKIPNIFGKPNDRDLVEK